MSEKTVNIIVGVTALVGLAGTMFLLLLFGHVPSWMESGYEVIVRIDNASGLTNDSRVRLSGIDIGRVISVRLRGGTQQGVEAVTLINEDVRIPAGVRVKAESPLLGSSPTLAFEVDHLSEQQMAQSLPTDGSAVLEGVSLTLVSQLAGQLEAAIHEPARKFAQLTDSFNRLSTEWTAVGSNLNRLIEVRSVDEVDSGKVGANLATVLTRADDRLRQLQSALEGLNQWTSDSSLREDVAATAANAKQLTQSLGQSVDRLTKRYVAVADDLTGVVETMRVVLAKAQSGEGTIGKLFHDPALYDNLNDSAQRLEITLDEMRLLVQKWKAEGLPLQF